LRQGKLAQSVQLWGVSTGTNGNRINIGGVVPRGELIIIWKEGGKRGVVVFGGVCCRRYEEYTKPVPLEPAVRSAGAARCS